MLGSYKANEVNFYRIKNHLFNTKSLVFLLTIAKFAKLIQSSRVDRLNDFLRFQPFYDIELEILSRLWDKNFVAIAGLKMNGYWTFPESINWGKNGGTSKLCPIVL